MKIWGRALEAPMAGRWVAGCLIVLWGSTNPAPSAEHVRDQWQLDEPVFAPSSEGGFDAVAVKDPSIVRFEGKWHLFYTARGLEEYCTGYAVSRELGRLRSAPRHELEMIRGKGRYGCAPQVFYYEPQRLWYLIFQNRDSNYQPAFSTTPTISDPKSWSAPEPLVLKEDKAKWIDFWVICDSEKAYLFYTRGHNEVVVCTTGLESFPVGWDKGEVVFRGVHESVHVYKVAGRDEYHMIYELNRDGERRFGLATAKAIAGPWAKVTDDYACGSQLVSAAGTERWTDMVSHGEALRSGHDQQMEYDPGDGRWLIQGVGSDDYAAVGYPLIPWKLGIIKRQRAEDDRAEGAAP